MHIFKVYYMSYLNKLNHELSAIRSAEEPGIGHSIISHARKTLKVVKTIVRKVNDGHSKKKANNSPIHNSTGKLKLPPNWWQCKEATTYYRRTCNITAYCSHTFIYKRIYPSTGCPATRSMPGYQNPVFNFRRHRLY